MSINNNEVSQTSFRNKDGIFIAGAVANVQALYGRDIFTQLQEIQTREADFSSVLGSTMNFASEAGNKKLTEIGNQLSFDQEQIKSLNIIPFEGSGFLVSLKQEIQKIITQNNTQFEEKDIILKVSSLSGLLENIIVKDVHDATSKYQDSTNFKMEVIDRLNFIKQKVNILLEEHPSDSLVLELSDKLKARIEAALDIHSMMVNFESIRSKTNAAGINVEDLWKQMFGGGFSKAT